MSVPYPRPPILRHIPDQGYAVIEASAGTGKTFTLEHLIVELLLRDQALKLENILVVTFTERATAELKTRVREMLSKIVHATRALVEQPELQSETVTFSDPQEQERHWVITAADRARLERALFSFDVAPIYTIHGFCQRVLTEFAFAQSRAFDQRHIELPVIFERAFTDAMRRTLATDERTRDWLEAWLEISTVDELRDLLYRCLVMQAELWPRFFEDDLDVLMAEFGSTFWESYRELYTRPAANRERAFKRAQAEYARTGSIARFLMEADGEVLDLKHSLHQAEPQTPKHERFMKLAGKLLRFKPAIAQRFLPLMVEALEREKRKSGAYTYDDMLSLVWESLSGPGGQWLTQTLRRRYRWALIDEFQDTDGLQWDIFRHLFFEGDEGNGLVVIGDPKQAIYGFRGADVQTYLHACQVMLGQDSAPDGEVEDDEAIDQDGALISLGQLGAQDEDDEAPRKSVKLHLEDNYRSTPDLINAYNAILEQSDAQPLFSGPDIVYSHPVRCGQPDLEVVDAQGQRVGPCVIGVMKRKEGSTRADVSTDEIYECYGRWIAFQIQQLLSDDGALYFGKAGEHERISASDIYILTRSGADEARLERYLQEAGVPYALYKHEGLFQTREASELYTLLKAIDDPHDRSKRLKAWETPFFGLKMESLANCREVRESDPLYKALIDWNQLARQQRFEALFTDVLQRSGLVRREIFAAAGERELTNYLHLMEVLLEEAHLGRLDFTELVIRAKAFIEQRRKPIGEDGNVKRLESDRDAVQLLTMHKSKGLEAPIVFLYAFGGMAGEFWPFHYDAGGKHVRALHIQKPEGKISPRLRERVEQCARQEDERLLYVALTRAKARLYLPFVPYAENMPVCKHLAQRSYMVLNDRLRAMWPSLHERKHLFEIDEIPYFGLHTASPVEDERALALAASWEPPVEHLQSPQLPMVDERFERIRPPTRQLESYSSLKRREGGYSTPALVHEDELRVEDELGAPSATGEDELPGGVRTGQCLHDILERLDYATLTRYADWDDWAHAPEVRSLAEQSLVLHGLEPEHLDLSLKILYRTLTATVEVEHGVIYGLGMCIPNLRELEFMYPLPQAEHPFLDQRADQELRVDRGFIKGYIDYVFEWRGRIYFVDWKSDILERYDGAALYAHFEANYMTQVMLYTIALCKIMSIHDAPSYEGRFGGAIYCFLRGMKDDSHQGLVRCRPSWQQLLDFERALRPEDAGGSGLASRAKGGER